MCPQVQPVDGAEGGRPGLAKPESWTSMLFTKGVYSYEDCMNDIAEIKFERPLPLKVSIYLSVKTYLLLSSIFVEIYIKINIVVNLHLSGVQSILLVSIRSDTFFI